MEIMKRIAGILFSSETEYRGMGGNSDAPESWWIRQKENVVGRKALDDVFNSRQIDTYRAVYDAISARSVHEVADLGCNTAVLGMLLYKWGYEGSYTGLDSNPYALELAGKTLGMAKDRYKLKEGNIRSLPLEDGEFECVVVKDVLEHLEDYRQVLGEALRVSSRLVIIANFIPWTEGKTVIRREPQGYYHNMYNRKEVYDFAGTYGYHIEEVISALEKDARPNEVVVFSKERK